MPTIHKNELVSKARIPEFLTLNKIGEKITLVDPKTNESILYTISKIEIKKETVKGPITGDDLQLVSMILDY